jgi:hypothetical protein
MRYFLIVFFIGISCHLQAQIDHWESVILEGEEFKFLVPTAELPTDWKQLNFDEAGWNTGVSGFGYGDGDDATEIPGAISVFLRKKFSITDIGAVERMVLNMDFDDGFVAYINGQEVARSFMSGSLTFNQLSNGLHEALLYQGLAPESFEIAFDGLVADGENILAIQVHNQGQSSSDLSAIPFLTVAINNSSMDYQTTPSWFSEPLDFTTSNLPIVIIQTNGQAIPNEPKIQVQMGIIYNGAGATNNITDPWNEYEGIVGIETRGYSSQGFPKNNYGIETWDANGNDIDTTFLGFPSEEDFVLHGPYSDKSLMNNVLTMKLGNEMGQYASRTRFVELMINDDYKGLYVFMEKIKRDSNRVDIAKLGPTENSGDDVTGGYIFKVDRRDEPGFESEYNAYNTNERVYFAYSYPDGDDMTPEQEGYIQGYVRNFENAIANSPQNSDYLNYLDLRSFVDNLILNELSKNVDAYRLSSFYHKDKNSKGGKITAGPFWDFNLAFGNGDYCGGDDITGWEFYQCSDGGIPFWWDKFIQDPVFTNALRCRWEELRQTTLSEDHVNALIDGFVSELGDARERNFQRWPTLGTYVWPNSWFYAQSTTHDQVVGYLKDWMRDRSEWLDNNIPGVSEDCEIYAPPYEGLITVTGVADQSLEILQVYPNPASDVLYVRGTSVIMEVSVIDMMGRAIAHEYPIAKAIEVHVKGSPEGMYLVQIKTKDETLVRRVYIK